MIDILMIIAGLVLLYFGGEYLIKGAVSLANYFGLSKLVVSTIIVGFGTSMPEMTVSIGSALKGSSDIALGNVVGSNIANILLIIGIAALIAPIAISKHAVRRDTVMMMIASVLLCGLTFIGIINLLSGIILFTVLLAFIGQSLIKDKKEQNALSQTDEEDEEEHYGPLMASVYSIGGLLVLIGGAYLMVEGAVSMARDFGISEAVIGLTVVAIGTSLPELATAVIAALRKQNEIIIGNILGSNIFNIHAILGITAMIFPIKVSGQIAHIDIWIMLGVSVFFSAILLRGVTIGRLLGAIMLAFYCGYILYLYLGGAVA